LIDASINPNYPAATKGDAYTFSAAGKIGGAAGPDVEARDVLYCINDNVGGDEATVGGDWNIIQSNLVQATELVAGILKMATGAEAIAGLVTDKAISPVTLKAVLDSLIVPSTEGQTGISQFANQAETLADAINNKTVSPLNLGIRLQNYLNHETILSIATANMNPAIRTTPGRNKYTAINGNLIVGKDIRIKAVSIPTTFSFTHVLNFPKPLNVATPHQQTIMLSNLGNVFRLDIDSLGRVMLSGIFSSTSEELILNLTPYLAKFPLEFHGTQPPTI
jgi:hypothetical protein